MITHSRNVDIKREEEGKGGKEEEGRRRGVRGEGKGNGDKVGKERGEGERERERRGKERGEGLTLLNLNAIRLVRETNQSQTSTPHPSLSSSRW